MARTGAAWRPRAALGCVALVLVLSLAGCQSELDRFADQLRPLDRQLAAQKADIASTLRGARLGNDRDARLLRQQVDGLAQIHRSIAGLDRPGAVKTQVDRYVRANAAEVVALTRVVAAIEAGDRAALRKAIGRARLSEEDVRSSGDDLRDALDSG